MASLAHLCDIFPRDILCLTEVSGLLTDIGTEELGHFEMISTMVHQLTRNLTIEQIKGTPFEAYYVDHTAAVWPQAAGGIPFNACEFQSKAMPSQI